MTDEDVGRMPYLEKVMKELFRLHPGGPLLVPRLSTQEVEIAGGEYSLPQGQNSVCVNAWALGCEERTWGPRASEFSPECFQEQCLDVKGQHFELLPFGSGRRMCPGMHIGLAIVHCTVANSSGKSRMDNRSPNYRSLLVEATLLLPAYTPSPFPVEN
ncbi:hypothetical protein KP509_06G049500 [Ceratopteris richardii]|uniref:Cytochrome P450 n=1 Tax=Ceratopteris richardii TaxID=49495 RepID=A0A8T2UFT9_CERRI|nr:hypothetical protein KP509_06G049500 [Ceratopteris richardii]